MSQASKYVRAITYVTLGLAGAVAVALSIFQLWQGITADLSAPVFRPVHLTVIIVLVFLTKPLFASHRSTGVYVCGRLVDLALIVCVTWAGWLIVHFDYDDMRFLLEGVTHRERLAGCLMIVALLEATRRSIGSVMVCLGLFFLVYSMFGDALPANLASKGFSVDEMIRFHIFSLNGIFGQALGIAASVVFTFILFGSFLQVTGAGEFFIDCAFAIAGRYRGGPAKASVLASAALGSISGSAIANTVTTGAITIPMMKKLGYSGEQAAGIEAAASTGGQIMPPIMGAGAFIMAQFTGIPYSKILLVSIVPAILYFASTLLYVHLMACKLQLRGMEHTQKFRHLLKQGWHFLLPLVFITVLLILNYSPILVGVSGCGAILVAGMCRKKTRFSLPTLLHGMKDAALLALPVSTACAMAGIVVGVVGQTGIGLQFTQFLLTLSGGYLWSTFALVTLAASVLGMGLPVTAAYIVLSIVAVPALTNFGIPLLTAHMVLFWLSQVSNVTPPIALAAFAGAGIANASPMRTSIEACKLAQGFFLIPLMMTFSSLIVTSDVSMLAFVLSIFATIALIVAFAGGVEGLLFATLPILQRVLLLGAALGLLLENNMARGACFALVVIIVLANWYKGRRSAALSFLKKEIASACG